jgi:hypothetical protein
MTKTLSIASALLDDEAGEVVHAGLGAELPPDPAAEGQAERDVEGREQEALAHADLAAAAVQDAEVEDVKQKIQLALSVIWRVARHSGRRVEKRPDPASSSPDAVRHHALSLRQRGPARRRQVGCDRNDRKGAVPKNFRSPPTT